LAIYDVYILSTSTILVTAATLKAYCSSVTS